MKKILLFTIPHTGTNTMHYLFNVLGGVPVYGIHLQPAHDNDLTGLDRLGDQGDAVYVVTHRDEDSIRQSWGRRKNWHYKAFSEPHFQLALETQAKYMPMILERSGFIFPIEASNEVRAEMAINIMVACGATPLNKAFMKFIDTWPHFNSHTQSTGIENFKIADTRVTALAESLHCKLSDYLKEHQT